MGKKILIVDDDQGFGDLLKGVFEQAGYDITFCLEAQSALQHIHSDGFDLLVTDQRLPGAMNGIDLIRSFHAEGIDLPAIVISGYLDNDAIRDLIREGVEGVFIKPLNIFSLLKKAAEVLENASKVLRREQAASATAEEGAVEAARGTVGFISGISESGNAFVLRAREVSGFKRNLLLIGPPGSPFEQIGKDIIALSPRPGRCLSLHPGSVDLAACEKFRADAGGEPVVFLILDTEGLAPGEIEALQAFMDEHGGGGDVRMIFALKDSVEDLYDQEVIDEDFYLFLGTTELLVPALREMPEDLLELAQKEIARETDDPVSLDTNLRAFLLEQEWKENLVELRAAIVRAASLSNPMPPALKHFQAVLNPETAFTTGEATAYRSSLERFLSEERHRFLAASALLGIS